MVSRKCSVNKFQLVTDKLVSLLEQGTKPWQKPWHSSGLFYGNLATGSRYSGSNPLLCSIDCLVSDYSSPFFIGFNQAKEKGWKVRRGAKATYLRWGALVPKSVSSADDDSESELEFVRLFRWVPVFNADWLDDSNADCSVIDAIARFDSGFSPNPDSLDQRLDSFIAAQDADIRVNQQGKAFCSSSGDFISLPPFERFSSASAYYATKIHELIHWTGHSSRLDRPSSTRFGSPEYAFEELVAELGAALLGAHFGFEAQLENHASYLASWLEALKGDNRFFFKAVAQARHAVSFLAQQADVSFDA